MENEKSEFEKMDGPNVGKLIRLGRSVYKIVSEQTKEHYPNTFRAFPKTKYLVAIHGPRGAVGIVTIWDSSETEQKACITWIGGATRNVNLKGPARAFEPYVPLKTA